jgi:hypothetical protein
MAIVLCALGDACASGGEEHRQGQFRMIVGGRQDDEWRKRHSPMTSRK